MTKTVAERLREINDYSSTVGCELFNMLNGTRDCTDWTCKGCRKATYTALADMIEAEQAELRELCCDKADLYGLPIDGDGEPCWLDDAVWHKGRKHLVVAVSHKGKVCIRDWETGDSGKGAVWVKAKSLTHKEPEVLDADGVPIKVGDTVYSNGGLLTDTFVVEGFDNCQRVIAKGMTANETMTASGDKFTHRKPDTQEAIDADAALSFAEYTRKWPCPIDRADDSAAWHREHLLARQRKLLGGE